jgi:RecA-family ATPase
MDDASCLLDELPIRSKFFWPESEELKWLIDGWIQGGTIASMYGTFATHKTQLATWISMCIAAGLPSLSPVESEPKGVLYIDSELGEQVFKQKVRRPIERSIGGFPENWYYLDLNLTKGLRDIGVQELLRRFIASHKIELVVLDSWSATFSSVDQNDNGQISECFSILRKTFPAMLIIDHAGHAKITNGVATPSHPLGASTKGNTVRTRWKVVATTDGVTLTQDKNSFGEKLAAKIKITFDNKNDIICLTANNAPGAVQYLSAPAKKAPKDKPIDWFIKRLNDNGRVSVDDDGAEFEQRFRWKPGTSARHFSELAKDAGAVNEYGNGYVWPQTDD